MLASPLVSLAMVLRIERRPPLVPAETSGSGSGSGPPTLHLLRHLIYSAEPQSSIPKPYHLLSLHFRRYRTFLPPAWVCTHQLSAQKSYQVPPCAQSKALCRPVARGRLAARLALDLRHHLAINQLVARAVQSKVRSPCRAAAPACRTPRPPPSAFGRPGIHRVAGGGHLQPCC